MWEKTLGLSELLRRDWAMADIQPIYTGMVLLQVKINTALMVGK